MNKHVPPPDRPNLRSPRLSMTTRAVDDMPRRRWTVAEIEAMVEAGIIAEDERFELIDGDAVPMSPKGSKHESYKVSLSNYWLRRRSDAYVIAQETTFHLDPNSFLEPDFVFYDANVRIAQLSPDNTWLAVEIADSSVSYDKGRKAKLYSRFGIPALWVLNVKSLNIHVFEKPGPDGYKSIRIVKPDEQLAPDFAPELALKLSELPLI
jgi:Uma2 family endonuclease